MRPSSTVRMRSGQIEEAPPRMLKRSLKSNRGGCKHKVEVEVWH